MFTGSSISLSTSKYILKRLKTFCKETDNYQTSHQVITITVTTLKKLNVNPNGTNECRSKVIDITHGFVVSAINDYVVWVLSQKDTENTYRLKGETWEKIAGTNQLITCGQPGVWGVYKQDIYYRTGTRGSRNV